MSQPVLFIGGSDAAFETSRVNRETPPRSRKDTPHVAGALTKALAKADNAHFERPDSPYPHLELAFDTSNVVELNTFPPAAASGFPPEEEQLLRHTNSVAISKIVTLNVRSQACKGDAANDGFVRLAGTMAPSVVVVEAARCC
jgi:hypothetical protein